MTDLLSRALDAAYAAGDFLLYDRPPELSVSSKSSAVDAVTQMDQGSERLIVDRLLMGRPDDAVLGEEGGERQGTSGVRWIVDPLDGTVNYIYGIPDWSVCIAAEVDGQLEVGVVHAPAHGRTWWAQGDSASLVREREKEPRPLAVSVETDLSHSLISTGFSYHADRRERQGKLVAELLPQFRDIRRAGSAALDMCRVAEGSLDGHYEHGLNPWDYDAATLIVRNAGGRVGGVGDEPTPDLVVAAGPGIFESLRSRVIDLP